VIIIKMTDTERPSAGVARVEIPSRFGPALRSAMEDMTNEIGGRLEGIHQYEKEDALTEAAAAANPLRAAVNAVVPEGHIDHEQPTARFYQQDALAALRPLREAITQVIPEGHPDYE
jgi:hypothetical protein